MRFGGVRHEFRILKRRLDLLAIAHDTRVRHELPQHLVAKEGEPVWIEALEGQFKPVPFHINDFPVEAGIEHAARHRGEIPVVGYFLQGFCLMGILRHLKNSGAISMMLRGEIHDAVKRVHLSGLP